MYFLPTFINGRVEVFMLWLPFWTLVKDGVNAVYVQGFNAKYLNLFCPGTVVGVVVEGGLKVPSFTV